MTWTAQQQAAIAAQGKQTLVAAAAGSGKTAVLVARLIRLLTTGVCEIDQMLVLTFTNAAAAEMRERIEAALQEAVGQATDTATRERLQRQLILLSGAAITTIDAFCQRILRMNIAELDIDPQFRAMDQQEQALLAQEVMDQELEALYAEGDAEFLHFADAYGSDTGDAQVRELIQQTWHFAQSQPFPEDWLEAQPARYAEQADLWAYDCLDKTGLAQQIAQTLAVATAFRDYAVSLGSDGYTAVGTAVCAELQRAQEALQTGASWDEVRACVQAVQFPRAAGPYRETLLAGEAKAAVQNQRAACKESVDSLQELFKVDAAGLREEMAATQQMVTELCQLTLRYGRALQAAKREKRVIDFGDMEHFALDLLCNREVRQATGQLVPTPAAMALQEKYAAIVVDEYQDTNAVQEAIVQLIARREQPDVFLVGDVKQSIYRFRQADPEIFQQKQATFPQMNPDLYQLISLSRNFRSRACVLDSINVLFTQLMQPETMEIDYDEAAALYPGLDYPALPEGAVGLAGPLEVVHILDDGEPSAEHTPLAAESTPSQSWHIPQGLEAEGDYIARRLKAFMTAGTLVYDKHTGVYRAMHWRDVAILYRGGASVSQQLLTCLRAAGIPAYASADSGYFAAQEVRVMLALLTCLDNVRQDIPLAAVMASPIGGFSMSDMAKIRLAAPPHTDLYAALLHAYQQDSGLSTRLADKAAAFCDRLSTWRLAARQLRVPELINYLYQETGYYNYVGGLAGGLLQQANLRLLSDRAAAYEKTNYRGLNRFLRFIDRLRAQENDLAAARTLGAGEDVVRIMTIHKSKGLEFPLVFLVASDKKFKLLDAGSQLLCDKKLGIGLQIADRATGQRYQTLAWRNIERAGNNASKAEEMRLLYVALTRARERLIITSSGSSKAWDGRLKKVAALADAAGEALPGAQVLAQNNYLSWLLMALVRLPDGAPLREAAGLAAGAVLTLPRFGAAHFQVQTLAAADLAQPVREADAATDALLAAVARGEPLPATAAAERVTGILAWQYPEPALAQVAAKLSVSEIKRRFREADEQPQPVTAALLGAYEPVAVSPAPADKSGPMLPDMPGTAGAEHNTAQPWQRPAFLQARSRTGAEYGTLLHTVMQHLDFRGATSYRGLKAQLAGMVEREIILPTDVPAIYLKSLQAFCDSPLGEALRKAAHVWRELPFCRLLPARDFYPNLPAHSQAQCFVQGIIDLLYEDADGTLVLVDYKTDRDTDPQHAHERHYEQLKLYRAAVEALTGRTVSAAWLFMLKDGTMVAM